MRPVMKQTTKKCHVFLQADQFKGSLGESEGCGSNITPSLFFFKGLPVWLLDESSDDEKMLVVPGM